MREKQLREIWPNLGEEYHGRIRNQEEPTALGGCAEAPADYITMKSNSISLTSIAFRLRMLREMDVDMMETRLNAAPLTLLYDPCANCRTIQRSLTPTPHCHTPTTSMTDTPLASNLDRQLGTFLLADEEYERIEEYISSQKTKSKSLQSFQS